jgi:hypothetical protein
MYRFVLPILCEAGILIIITSTDLLLTPDSEEESPYSSNFRIENN